MRRSLTLLLLTLWPVLAPAQEAAAPEPVSAEQTERDRSYLTGLIEDNLSGAGRSVRLDGFAGALSSRATFETLSIADENGVWLTIRDGAMSWNRRAILAGRFEIRELSAAEIELPRLPVTGEAEGASPEAKPFSFALPELPVSIDIGTLKADKVILGEALMGQAATVKLSGQMHLEGGEGNTRLSVERIDGQKGIVALTGAYANTTRQLDLDLLVEEGKDGIAATLLGLPGTPAIALAVSGSDPTDNFTADLALSTEGKPRLTGKVALSTVTTAPDAPPEKRFSADLSGDIAPLLAPAYREFFGANVALLAEGHRGADGVLSLSKLEIDSEALDVAGTADILPSGLPARADLTIRLGLDSGEEVLLPLGGKKTWVRRGTLGFKYDSALSDGWSLDARVMQLRRSEGEILNTRLSGSGRIGHPDGQNPTVGGTISFAAGGIAPADPALQEAFGSFISGKTIFFWQKGGALNLQNLRVIGRDLALGGRMKFDNLASGLDMSGDLTLRHDSLARFSALAGRALGGALDGQLSGRYTLLSGAFDVNASVTGRDLLSGQEQLDGLLQGRSEIIVSALRDENGITLRKLNATARQLVAQASGALNTGASVLRASARMGDLSVLGGNLRGTLQAEASLTETNGARQIGIQAKGDRLAVGLPEIDRILAGQSLIDLSAEERDGHLHLQTFRLENPQLSAEAEGSITDAVRKITLSARLANTALLAPGFPGPLQLGGTVVDDNSAYLLDLNASGPGNSRATVSGSLATDLSTSDLAISGGAETALINAFIAPRTVQGPLSFDLRMQGKPALAALSGLVTVDGARMVAPAIGVTLENLVLRADLAGARTTLSGDAAVKGGGGLSVSGAIGLTSPFQTDLRVELNAARLRDPELYDTRISGPVTVSGPLKGGARVGGTLTLDETELRIPSSGLAGIADIPEIDHVAEPASVRSTRARAGVLASKTTEAARSGGVGLDLTVLAPRRIFVRGRGLDAELGGSLRLTGTSNNMIPIGEFSLVRGRLDVLAKRFTLDEGKIAMQGALEPWLMFRATTKQDEYTISLTLVGDASEPELIITSSPELPEEEVLARLLFNRGLTNLSALQAVQLASAVATLAGKGGAGVMSKLREGTGLDDLDLSTDETGGASFRAGKYLSENLYTDLSINSDGQTELNLNLDVTPNLTARGSVGSDSTSSIGIFYEKDY
ncbi:translocation/assembly module TamB domain-containing protein [Sedimentimonas flavescens]|uniref:translocation/assembly module TamB domain-containing protein n=1 Tax=Sedimentimonas flavescens TaxID=2851012 RepID=UPI001C4A55D0|nr:translocation/assembly module TamB domain-containing protein [Sedimentimonas flavescens]MBW0158137.1 translocation/assembly module TamB domain-containing protein [Sedimentimonas flavescens]